MSNRSIYLFWLFCLFFITGCGGGGGGSGTGAAAGNSSQPNSQPAVQTARIQLNNVLARAIPSQVTHLRLTGYDTLGTVRYGPRTQAKAPVMVFDDVPLSVRKIQIELLVQDRVAGVAILDVILSLDQTETIDDFAFSDVEKELVSISVEPAVLTLAKGTTGTLKAIGHYNDGTVLDLSGSVTWASSNASVHLLSGGQLQADQVGQAKVLASFATFGASATVNVTKATLKSISIEPGTASVPSGLSQQFTVKGTYSDQSVQDITGLASFQSSADTIADNPDTANVFKGLQQGQATITATVNSFTATAGMEVTPGVLRSLSISPGQLDLPLGTAQNLSVMGTFSDGNVTDMTDKVLWTSSAPATCEVTPEGLVRGLQKGQATVSAVNGQVQSEISVTVTDPIPTGLTVSPTDLSVDVGDSRQVEASATYSDGTMADVTQVATFQSSNSAVAGVNTMTNRGLVQGVAEGQTTVTASFGGFQAETTVTVTPHLTGDLEVRVYNVTARQVDDVVKSYRMTLLAAPYPGGSKVDGPKTYSREFSSSQQSLFWTAIPTGDYVLWIEFLDQSGGLRGEFRQLITIRGNETTLVDNPVWSDTPLTPPTPIAGQDPKTITRTAFTGTPRGLAYDSTRHRVYLSNQTQGTVEVYDTVTKTLQTPIVVGSAPWGLDLTADHSKLVVCLSGASRMATVDLTQTPPTVTFADVTVGSNTNPRNVAVAQNGKALFGCVFPGSGWTYLYELDTNTNTVTRRTDLVGYQQVRDPLFLGASGDRSTLLLAEGNSTAGEFFLYHSSTDSFGSRRKSDAFMSRANLNADGSEIEVSSGFFTDKSERLGTLLGRTSNFCYSALKDLGFRGGTSFELVDLKTRNITESIPLEASITGPMTSDESGRRVFALAGNSLLDIELGPNRPPHLQNLSTFAVPVGQTADLTLSAVDPDGDPVSIEAVQLPNGAGYDPATKVLRYHPTAATASEVSAHFVVSDGTTSASASVALQALPQANEVTLYPTGGTLANLQLTTDDKTLYVTNNDLNRIEKLDLSAHKLLSPIDVGMGPRGLDVSSDGQQLLVCDNRGEFLEIVELPSGRRESIYSTRDSMSYDESRPFEITYTNNGKALYSSDYSGSGFESPRELDLTTKAITVRGDAGILSEPLYLAPSADRSTVWMAEGDISTASLVRFVSASGVFQKVTSVSAFAQDIEQERNGNRFAFMPGPRLFDSNGLQVASSTNFRKFTFLTADYGAAHNNTAEISILRLDTMAPVATVPLPTNANGSMMATADGRTLFVICDKGLAVVNLGPVLDSLVPK